MQPSIDVFRKSCSENVQQIYMRTPACGTVILIKLQSNFLEITLRHGYSSVNFLHIFITSFPKNTSGGLLLFFPMCPFDLLWFIRKSLFFWYFEWGPKWNIQKKWLKQSPEVFFKISQTHRQTPVPEFLFY